MMRHMANGSVRNTVYVLDIEPNLMEAQELTTELAAEYFFNRSSDGSGVAADAEEDSDRVTPFGVQILMCLMYITISLAAIGGNGVVIYIIFAYKRMRTVTNFFIMNLAIGDMLMACLCIPFTFVSNLILQYWPFGAIMCLVVSYAQAVSVFISAYTLIAISIDRYIAIIYPLRPRMTKLQSKLIIIFIWIVALITPLPSALLSKLVPIYQDLNDSLVMASSDEPLPALYQCTEVWPREDYRYYYSMLLMILQYAFPFSVLIFTYSRIAIVVWGKRPPGEAEDQRDARMAASKRKMVKMMITCVATFTLCWLPFNILIVVGDEYKEIYDWKDIVYVWFACHWLSMSHACYNPLIYIWMNGRFRDGFKYVFRFLPCIKRSQRPDFIPHFSTSAQTTGTMRRLNTHLHKNGHVHSHIHDNNKSICM